MKDVEVNGTKITFSPDMQISQKGRAMIAAVESGLVPVVVRDGEVVGFDTDHFERFWDIFSEMELEHSTNAHLRQNRKK